MTKLEKIEESILSLSRDDRRQLGEWFDSVREAEFDAAIEKDAASGKLDSLADKVLSDFRAGRTRPL